MRPQAHIQAQAKDRVLQRRTTLRDEEPILEDLHEADRSSLLLLEFLARQIYDIRVLVLATYREPEADLKDAVRDTVGIIVGHGHRIALGGLQRNEIDKFLSQSFEISLTENHYLQCRRAPEAIPSFLTN
jgi:predicted ATPase